MKIPTLQGLIDRRILVNFTADPEVVQKIIPKPFRPEVYHGKAIVGICLIRLKHVRPSGFPGFIGLSSENGAHRFAVEWEENGELKKGVYIPRRDSSSLFNNLVGGRLFPGKHYLAKFEVEEKNDHYKIAFTSSDKTYISIDAERTQNFSESSIFKTLDTASGFFENGSTGYSPNGTKFDGMVLKTNNWKVEALKVNSVRSSFFEDPSIFPPGSVQFDNALLMTQIEHVWNSTKDIQCCT